MFQLDVSLTVHRLSPHPTSRLPGPTDTSRPKQPYNKPHCTTTDTHALSPRHSTRSKQTHITHDTKYSYNINTLQLINYVFHISTFHCSFFQCTE